MEDRFALLIDADNVSAKYIKPILDELSKYGNVTYKRIYGDWTKTNNASWKEELLQNSITPIQQFSYTHGKNATDSAMIIDAMDMLYTSELEGFCLVSSDSDFTKLASRLRESGKTVIGMGEGKTPSPFRKACDIFTELELLLEDNTMGKEERNTHSHASGKWQKKDNHDSMVSKEKIEEAVVKIITENQNNDRETGLGEVGSRLVKLYPDFDVRRYGYSLSNNYSYGNEVEYIIYGNSNEKNKKSAYGTIFAIRYALNLPPEFQENWNDGTLSGMAIAIESASSGIIPAPLFKLVVVLGLTAAETASDMQYLKNGMPVELVKNKDQLTWTYAGYSEKAVSGKGFFYSDYLKLILFTKLTGNNEYAVYARIADVIQANMGQKISNNSGFVMKKANVYYSAEANLKVEPLMLNLPLTSDYSGSVSDGIIGQIKYKAYKGY